MCEFMRQGELQVGVLGRQLLADRELCLFSYWQVTCWLSRRASPALPRCCPHLCTIPSPLRAPLKQIFSLAQPLTCNLWLRMVMKAFFDVGAVGTVVTCKGSELCCINDLQAHIL